MKILVTAGPTREAIDPVRFISNRSSGKMGYALAEVALSRGHEVTLISGPVSLPAIPGVRLVRVVSADDMSREVRTLIPWSDALIMAAAVADWRPRLPSATKIKKSAQVRCLELEPVPDILSEIRAGKGDRLFVGFAAETGSVEAEAHRKLQAKGLDLIVANDVSAKDAGFEVDTNRVVLVTPDGAEQHLPLMSKRDVAARILAWVETHGADTGSRV